jgi:nucleotide-binding universal stress UspA family protein
VFPVHTILHPTDFSDRSQYALHLACALVRDYGARLIVLHVLPIPPISYGEAMIYSEFEESRSSSKERLDSLPMPDAEIHALRLLEEGEPTEVILRVAQEIPADLIVLGTHGRTGLTRLVMGSVAEAVVRKAACPVLTVKSPLPEAIRETELTAAASHG